MRKPRIEIQRALSHHHRGNNRQLIFRSDDDYRKFLFHLAHQKAKLPFSEGQAEGHALTSFTFGPGGVTTHYIWQGSQVIAEHNGSPGPVSALQRTSNKAQPKP